MLIICQELLTLCCSIIGPAKAPQHFLLSQTSDELILCDTHLYLVGKLTTAQIYPTGALFIYISIPRKLTKNIFVHRHNTQTNTTIFTFANPNTSLFIVKIYNLGFTSSKIASTKNKKTEVTEFVVPLLGCHWRRAEATRGSETASVCAASAGLECNGCGGIVCWVFSIVNAGLAMGA